MNNDGDVADGARVAAWLLLVPTTACAAQAVRAHLRRGREPAVALAVAVDVHEALRREARVPRERLSAWQRALLLRILEKPLERDELDVAREQSVKDGPW